MAAVGICNIAGSFFGSFPVNASFSRAAVSNASGIRTPLGGVYTSKLCFLNKTDFNHLFSSSYDGNSCAYFPHTLLLIYSKSHLSSCNCLCCIIYGRSSYYQNDLEHSQ